MGELGRDPATAKSTPVRGDPLVLEVVCGHLLIGPVDLGFVAAGPGHTAFQIIRHPELRLTTEKPQHAGMRPDPVRKLLAQSFLGVGVPEGPQHAHKQLHRERPHRISNLFNGIAWPLRE